MDEEEYYVKLMNIFIKHYNTINHININMFDGIKEYEDTNNIMEEFMAHIDEFKTSDENTKKIYGIKEINIENFDQLYGLMIDDDVICVCEILIPLIKHIADNLNFVEVNWKIKPMVG